VHGAEERETGTGAVRQCGGGAWRELGVVGAGGPSREGSGAPAAASCGAWGLDFPMALMREDTTARVSSLTPPEPGEDGRLSEDRDEAAGDEGAGRVGSSSVEPGERDAECDLGDRAPSLEENMLDLFRNSRDKILFR